MEHDNVVHHPLGAAAYYYQSKETFLRSQLRNAGVPTDPAAEHKPIVVHIGAQPNSLPHAGTLICFALAFVLSKAWLELHPAMDISITLDFVDTAPDNGAIDVPPGYQRSHRFSRAMEGYLGDYFQIMNTFMALSGGIQWTHSFQSDLNSQSTISTVVKAVVEERDIVGPMVSPKKEKLPLRASCPQDGCGLADKAGTHNQYTDNRISFRCPTHDRHFVDLEDANDCKRLEYNTPLRNLIRNLVWGMDQNSIHVRVTGSDYAGAYQEDLFARPWRHIISKHPELRPVHTAHGTPDPPVTIFSPLLTDWAGSKLSKSLYVTAGAYQYMKDQGVDYLLSVARMRELGRDPSVIFHEVTRWLEDPKHLFTRSYSVEYIHSLFTQAESGAD
ncbi:hypothetical protein M422DRAFT_33206 [Sphaerobolus stellatus SS14]|uniref:Uncharacterized protein n=1 Tax=Sphaerobolus stellatus (strain SS14) TaxID=990650 RepID=A0A0C9U6H1_SPHS4|nr:hypothetical protein M422DRAFT_33206 [Sphaerobolus stellatus SS14]